VGLHPGGIVLSGESRTLDWAEPEHPGCEYLIPVSTPAARARSIAVLRALIDTDPEEV